MKTSCCLRVGFVLGFGCLLTACGDKQTEYVRMYDVVFTQPFPDKASDKVVFPARHQGVYTAVDSTTSLCIGRTAVWKQGLRKEMFSRQQLKSLLIGDSTYRDIEGQLHYLRWTSRDSVRDSWLWRDTIFTLTGARAGRLRKFQGRYYLNTPAENAESWQVQRLEITGRRLLWQNLGQDTLRLRALDTASVRIYRNSGFTLFQLKPTRGQQTRRVDDYTGLWETAGEFTLRY